MSHHDQPETGGGPAQPPMAAAPSAAAPLPPPAPPAPAAAPAPPAAPAVPPGPDAAAKLEEVMADLTKRFGMPELLAGGGALLVLAVWALFGVILNTVWPDSVVFSTAVLLLFVIAGQRMGMMDFGQGHRTLIIVLGLVMGAMLVYSVLAFVRGDTFGIGGTYVIGLILAWIGQGAAAAGAFLTWQSRRT